VIADSNVALENSRRDEIHAKAAEIIDRMELDGIGIDFSDP
jgi:hypothetical protein